MCSKSGQPRQRALQLAFPNYANRKLTRTQEVPRMRGPYRATEETKELKNGPASAIIKKVFSECVQKKILSTSKDNQGVSSQATTFQPDHVPEEISTTEPALSTSASPHIQRKTKS